MDKLVDFTRLVFRCDASLRIGSGHVARCLTLADALSAGGKAECTFLCREMPGHMGAAIEARGHRAILLPKPPPREEPWPVEGLPPHAHWLGLSPAEDAEACLPFIAELEPGWVIVDHYALDGVWEEVAARHGSRILAIDDLADRSHRCDVLLDQNLGTTAADYAGRVPASARLLIGPEYALLRPEFARARPGSLARRQQPELKHIVISMGGMDQDDATGQVLDVLAHASPADVRITVVMGRSSPHLERVRQKAAAMPAPTDVLVEVRDMAGLMADADLAIGGAGGTAWERCCLGLPSLTVVVAENQAPGAEALVRRGAALDGGSLSTTEALRPLAESLARVRSPAVLSEMSKRAAEVCDGAGAARVLDSLALAPISLSEAGPEHVREIWEWRNAADAVRFYRIPEATTYERHAEWYARALLDPARVLLILKHNGADAGHVRFDLGAEPGVAEISIYLAESARGRGLGKLGLIRAREFAGRRGWKQIRATVHEDNAASLRAFRAAGFSEISTDGRFVEMGCDLRGASEGVIT